jgi:hypothetical protein
MKIKVTSLADALVIAEGTLAQKIGDSARELRAHGEANGLGAAEVEDAIDAILAEAEDSLGILRKRVIEVFAEASGDMQWSDD